MFSVKVFFFSFVRMTSQTICKCIWFDQLLISIFVLKIFNVEISKIYVLTRFSVDFHRLRKHSMSEKLIDVVIKL